MLTIKQFTAYAADAESAPAINALVANYGREYAVTLEMGREISIHRTNGRTGYERLPRWKVAADIKAITEFATAELHRATIAA